MSTIGIQRYVKFVHKIRHPWTCNNIEIMIQCATGFHHIAIIYEVINLLALFFVIDAQTDTWGGNYFGE